MNNPAAKEPSMDEILSSIRQIIADEDGPGKPAQEAEAAASADIAPAPAAPPASENEADAAMLAAVPATEPEPLALSAEQMIAEPESEKDDLGGISFNPEAQETPLATNSAKKSEPTPEPEPAPPAPVAEETPEPEPVAESEPEPVTEPEQEQEISLVVADDVAFDEAVPEQPVSSASASPAPSEEMSEKLLAPSTDAAARHAFSKLSALSIGGSDLTLEAIVRDMLRPMLKEWLDENLPATVERMVEKEIERVSRRG